MRLVEDPPSGCQQVLEPPMPDQVRDGVARPGQERGVGPNDGPVGSGREVAAGGVLVEVLEAFLDEGGDVGIRSAQGTT